MRVKSGFLTPNPLWISSSCLLSAQILPSVSGGLFLWISCIFLASYPMFVCCMFSCGCCCSWAGDAVSKEADSNAELSLASCSFSRSPVLDASDATGSIAETEMTWWRNTEAVVATGLIAIGRIAAIFIGVAMTSSAVFDITTSGIRSRSDVTSRRALSL